MTPLEARNLLMDCIATMTGFDTELVLAAYGDAGRPSVSHFLVTELSDVGVGYPFRDTPRTTILHARQLTIQLDGFGTDAARWVSRLASLLWSDHPARVVMVSAGATIQGIGNVRDTTALLAGGTTYEPRATLDVTVGYVSAETSVAEPTEVDQIEVDVIATGGVEGTFTDVIVDPQ